VNERNRRLCLETGCLYVDYHSRLAGEDGVTLRSELADDGLHPHSTAYEIMASALIDRLHVSDVSALERRAWSAPTVI
jgi:lysophospholipase L1-like esterase